MSGSRGFPSLNSPDEPMKTPLLHHISDDDWPETPFLAVDLDILERNIARMTRVIIQQGGKNWRPHVKAIKTPAIAHMLLRAGAMGVTCAKVTEAEVMAQAGIGDILIANEIVTPRKIR